MVAIESIMRGVGATTFSNIGDLKKQSSLKGFPQPMRAQMESSMPYKSDAQRRFFHTATARAKGISAATVKEFDKESKGKELPKKVRRHKVRFPKPNR